MITSTELVQVYGCSENRANKWIPHLNATMEKYEINTKLRVTSFIAQIGHESGKLMYVKELWGPTPAQERYEGREDLGNTQKGDGFKFLGRGLIQITGRKNYQTCGDALGIDLISHPELLELPEYASASAGLFWKAHGCNEKADQDDFLGITKIINGGYNGLESRQAIYELAKRYIVEV